MFNKFYIYIYIDLKTNEPFYVGRGQNKRYRIKPHLMHSPNKELKKRISCLGKNNIKILFDSFYATETEVFNAEIDLIKKMGRKINNTGPLLNITEGGDGTSGWHHSMKTRQKISKSNTGKIHSIETRKKMSKAKKGSIPWNKGLKGLPGRIKSFAEKEKISKRQQGEKSSNAILTNVQILDIRDIDFSKMKLKEKEKFAKSLNVSWTTIYDVINRRTWKHI